jgi:tetratricopeptide (TPR) repeat protein
MNWDKSGRLPKKVATVAALASALLATMPVDAGYNYQDPTEVAMLPPYCIYTPTFRTYHPDGNNPEKMKQWALIMDGKPYVESMMHNMHHYCEGLMDVNYAKFKARTPQERQFRLGVSISQFDYVIRAAPPDFKLLPEFFTKKGESLIATGRGQLAIAEFNRAIELKPDYWPPYAALSDYYRSLGSIKMAREVLEQGLAAAPDISALKRRLTELDTAKDIPKAAAESSKKKPAANAAE